MMNRPLFFRRALKIINGTLGNLPAPGLTIGAENPVYVQGNYNATGAAIAGNAASHVAAAILADSVTLLSNGWVDVNSFFSPNNPGARVGTATGYRMAIAAGKNLSFPQPQAWAAAQDYGTDGGVHNFLRYLEGWNASLFYRGSIVNLFNSRQAVGIYKCCTNVYGPPTRVYNFDSDFLLPSLLPPGTPMFRDVDTLTFRQLLLNQSGPRDQPSADLDRAGGLTYHRLRADNMHAMTISARPFGAALLAFLLTCGAASSAGAQSLADVAKKEAERRQAIKEPVKTYTNADLTSLPPATAADKAGTAATGDRRRRERRGGRKEKTKTGRSRTRSTGPGA